MKNGQTKSAISSDRIGELSAWRSMRLRDVCELVNGRAYNQEELLASGKYRVLRVGNFFTNNHWYYSDLELEDRKYCEEGDLLYAWSASFGPRIWHGEKVIYHYHIWKVVPNEEIIDRDFLLWFLQWDKELIKHEHGTGTTMLHVSKGSMEQREILIPPLCEQRRIVAKLNDLSDRSNAIRAEVDRLPRLVERYKQALLAAAFRGENTGSDWAEVSLRDVAQVSTGSTPKRGIERYYKGGTVPWVTSGSVNDSVVSQCEEHITQAALDETNCKVFPSGTLLVAMYGEGKTRGKVAVLGFDAATNQALAAIQVNKVKMLPEFLLWYLRLNYLSLRSQAAGGVQPNLNLGIIKSLRIPLPELSEQSSIVDAVEAAILGANRVHTEANRARDMLERMEAATLTRAFRGDLGEGRS